MEILRLWGSSFWKLRKIFYYIIGWNWMQFWRWSYRGGFRKISRSLKQSWWNKILKAICKDGRNDEGIGEITIVGRARLGTGRKEDGRARFSGSGSGFHRRKRRRVQEGWAAHGGCPLVNSGTQCRFCGRVSATRPSGTGPPLEWASR